jgi:hypothetical protein
MEKKSKTNTYSLQTSKIIKSTNKINREEKERKKKKRKKQQILTFYKPVKK